LFNRKRSKGRDIYDIIYLFSLTEPDYNYLKKVLKISKRKELVDKMGELFSEDDLEIAESLASLSFEVDNLLNGSVNGNE